MGRSLPCNRCGDRVSFDPIHGVYRYEHGSCSAGVVEHPSKWKFSGFNEIQNPRERYGLIDHESVMDFLEIKSMVELKRSCRAWVEESLNGQDRERKPGWTESIAVRSEAFV